MKMEVEEWIKKRVREDENGQETKRDKKNA